MKRLIVWLRVIGVFYLIQFIMMVFVKAPIRTLGPPGALDEAGAGNSIALFLVDTWVIFGLEVGGIGAALLIASRLPSQAIGLAWIIIAIELSRGILADIYTISRGYDLIVPCVWIVIHSAVIVTGLLSLQSARQVPT